MSESGYRRSIVAISALFGTILLLWALLTPAFRAPDEPQHYNSIMRIAAGGGWPAPGTATISDATLLAMREAAFHTSLPKGSPPLEKDFTSRTPLDPGARSVVDQEGAVDRPGAGADQMTQHPPLYYAIGAGVVKLFGALDWRWDQQLLLLRLLSVFLAVLIVPLAGATARALTASNLTGVVAAAMVVGIGQLAFINSTVTNDVLVTVLGMTLTLLAVRALQRRHTPGLVLMAGVVLGLGLLTKGFFLAAIPMVALSFLIKSAPNPRFKSRLVASGSAMAVAFVVGGWWWLKNLVVYGTIQPAGQVVNYPIGDTTPTVGEFLAGAFSRLSESFFGNFAWLEVPLPGLLIWPLTIVVLGLIGCSFFLAGRNLAALLTLMTFPIGVGGVVLAGAFAAYHRTGQFPGLQGRYLFISLGAIAGACALALVAVTIRITPKLARYLPSGVLLISTALAAFSAFWFFRAAYQAWDRGLIDALVRWESWSAFSRVGLAIVVLLPVALSVVALWVTLRESREFEQEDEAPPGSTEPFGPVAQEALT